ncbi:Mitochondrial outer membrane protein porin [Choanephora cucurbitarum]|uniref:Mitochondrial outer membrane protein porin n=1 Tax=Choanephora cucurbitarum TaxID=101091 RepID=A0A1C7NKL4_9FUNG|nr:Mitochondrial outer membrane protein porin [Choanephora cucurbitarum]
MSIPVAYNDIGKSSKDLLTKDFAIGGVKLEVKSTTSNGITFKVNSHRDNKTGIIVGDIESKYTDKARGISFTEAWTTSNHLNGRLELENNLAKGLKLELIGSYVPSIHHKSARLNAVYKQPHMNTTGSLDMFSHNVNVNTTIGANGYVAGGEIAYGLKNAKIQRYSAAIGYSTFNYAVALQATNNCNDYAASYYHRISSELEASGKATWRNKDGMNAVALEVGFKRQLDPTASIKGKITNTGLVSASYTQLIRQGVKVNVGAFVDSTRLDQNVHKLGLALTFEK